MPMSFPDMESLLQAAENWKFRGLREGESEQQYRTALADFVAPEDFIESQEIRTGKGWDEWDMSEKREMVRRAANRPRG